MAEFSIPIMFDVISATEAGAVARLVDALVDAELTANGDGTGGIDSWWTIEADHKRFDGNDNDAGEVVFQAPRPTQEVWTVTLVSIDETGGLRTHVDVYADEHNAHLAADTARDDGYVCAAVAWSEVC
jgi:hypothetical protein